MPAQVPGPDCAGCPRLAAFRAANRQAWPEWFNAPVPSFGDRAGALLIVGLAPGLRGANRTGRPFTGDHAGELLYHTLARFGLAAGDYRADPEDGLRLVNCRIANAVRCVPPENKPTGPEVAACRPYLEAEIAAMPRLRVVMALGAVAHGAVLAVLKERKSARPFGHGARHELVGGLLLADSYHCSRYNTNTGKLTPAMFDAVFEGIRDRLAPLAAIG